MGFPILLSFLIAILFTIILSLLIELIVYVPLARKKSSNNIILISSLGVMIVVINVIALFYGNETKIIKTNIV